MTPKSPILAALAIAAVALAGCNKTPATNTAYNNSGASATPGSSVTAPATTGSTDTNISSSTTTSTIPPSSTSDTSTQPSSTSASPSDTSSPASSTTTTIASSSPSGTTNVVTDTVSTGKIKAAFASEAGLKDSDISVDTANGVVTLTGSVKSREQIALATSVAQRQQGVTRVDSQITVK